MARPKKADTLNNVIRTRLNDKDYDKVKKLADEAGLSPSEFCRSAITGKRVNIIKSNVPAFHDFEAFRRLAVNVNQISRQMNIAGGFYSPELEKLSKLLLGLFEEWFEIIQKERHY